MKAYIYINRHVLAANKKASKESGITIDNPAVAVKTYKGVTYGKTIEFRGSARLVQDAEEPICIGATIWMEVDDHTTLLVDGSPLI